MAGIHFNAFGPVYVDGITFRLGEKFIPPAKVTLPSNNEVGNLSDVLFMDYDFSKEENFLKWREEWLAKKTNETEQRRKRLKEKEKARIEAEEEAQAKAEEEKEKARLQAIESHIKVESEQSDKTSKGSQESTQQSDTGQLEPKGETCDTSQSAQQSEKPPTVVSASLDSNIIRPPPFQVSSNMYENLGQNMLIPTPVSQTTAPASVKVDVASQAVKFNPADFEKEEDPFDQLELKTLNVMEELNKVLQGAQYTENSTQPNITSQAPTVSGVSAPYSQGLSSTPSSSMPFPNSYPRSVEPYKNSGYCSAYVHVYPKSQLPSNRSYSPAHEQYSGTVHQSSNEPRKFQVSPNNAQHGVQNYPSTSSFPQNGHYMPNFPTQMPSTLNSNLNNNVREPASTANFQYFAQPMQGVPANNLQSYPSFPAKTDASSASNFMNNYGVAVNPYSNTDVYSSLKKSLTTTLMDTSDQKLNGRKSLENSRCATPDLSQGLRSARSEPDLASLDLTQNNLDEMSNSTHSRLNPLVQQNQVDTSACASPPEVVLCKKTVPEDVYSELSSCDQKAANRIISMGFERNLAARAVKKFGTNEKTVVDFLCDINQLCDKGIKIQDAEAAMLATGNLKQAMQYLLLLRRFQEFGFSEQKVHEGLVKHNLDEEKTLDWLTCA